jgi:hypothetical protein
MDFSLSASNIEFLKKEISKSGLTYSHLMDELIDHVCCDVEYEMRNGLPFAKAYEVVKNKIGIEGLERIQHETLYLIDKKYRIMKNTMKISGLIAPILLAFGALSKIQHWPGADKILLFSIPLPFVVLLPAYILLNSVDKEINCKNLLAIMFFFAYFAAIIGFLAIRIPTNVIESIVRSAINIDNKTMALQENTKLVSEYSELNNPVSNEAEKLCSQINEVKRVVRQEKLEDPPIKSNSFLDARPVIEKRYLTDLKSGIRNFKTLVQKQYGSDSRMYRYIDDAFEIYNDASEDVLWEDAWMSANIVASALESLNLLEFKVRLVELESYDFLKK